MSEPTSEFQDESDVEEFADSGAPVGGWAEGDPWDAFVPDDDQCDPQPEPGDFWVDCDEALAPSN